MDIATASIDDLTWYRSFLLTELAKECDHTALYLAGISYSEWLETVFYMQRRFALCEERLAAIAAIA